jgi:hypothetical protein
VVSELQCREGMDGSIGESNSREKNTGSATGAMVAVRGLDKQQ